MELLERKIGYLTAINTFFNVVASALIAVIISRGLTVEERGSVYFAFQFVMIFSVITTFGMGQSAVFTVKNKILKISQVVKISSVVYILYFSFAMLATMVLIYYLSYDSINFDFYECLMIFFSIFFCGAYQLLYNLIQTKNEKIPVSLKVSIYGNLLYLVLFLVYWCFFELNVKVCIALFLFSWIFRVFLSSLNVFDYENCVRVRKKHVVVYLKRSWLFYCNVLMFTLFTKSNYMVAAIVLSAFDSGVYSLSITIVELSIIVPSAIGTILFPYITGNNIIDKDKAINNLSRVMFYVSIITCVLLLIFCFLFLNLVFGEDYGAAFNPIIIMIPGVISVSVVYALGNYLNSLGMAKVSSKYYLICFIISMPLTYYLTGVFGMNGSALSHSLVNIILTLMFLRRVYFVSREKYSYISYFKFPETKL